MAVSLPVIFIVMMMSYFFIGHKVWFEQTGTGGLVQNFLGTLKKEKILLIDSSISEKFEIKIITEDQAKLERDMS